MVSLPLRVVCSPFLLRVQYAREIFFGGGTGPAQEKQCIHEAEELHRAGGHRILPETADERRDPRHCRKLRLPHRRGKIGNKFVEVLGWGAEGDCLEGEILWLISLSDQ